MVAFVCNMVMFIVTGEVCVRVDGDILGDGVGIIVLRLYSTFTSGLIV